jgi:hypothetical protein
VAERRASLDEPHFKPIYAQYGRGRVPRVSFCPGVAPRFYLSTCVMALDSPGIDARAGLRGMGYAKNLDQPAKSASR